MKSRASAEFASGDYEGCNVVMKVAVREFKARMSRYLRAVDAGKDVVITSRGRPVARLIPVAPEPAEKLSRAEVLRRMSQIPGIQMGTGKKFRVPKKPFFKIKPGEKTMAEIVIEGRGPR
jgi:prevent-host-death family protein